MLRALQFIFVLFLCTVSAELTLRVWHYFSPSFIFYSNSYERFMGKPGQQLWGEPLNNKGFMDQDFSLEKNGKYRIAAIGDSFTFGVVPYQYNFITLLDEALAQEGLNTEIYNMGITGTGPREQYAFLLNEGLAYQPDMLLLSFFIGNDFSEASRKEFFENSFLLSFIYYVFELRPKLEERQYHRIGKYCDTCPTIQKENYMKAEARRSYVFNKKSERWQPAIEAALVELKNIKRLADKKGLKLLVVVIPDELQINQTLYKEVVEEWLNIGEADLDMTLPNRVLSDFFKKHNIAYIDLYDGFLTEGDKQALYKPIDSHWNIAGNKLAADLIKPVLKSKIAEVGQ